MIENTPSVITIKIIPLTTALVVDSPTALAPVLVCKPRKQPIAATRMPKKKAFSNGSQQRVASLLLTLKEGKLMVYVSSNASDARDMDAVFE